MAYNLNDASYGWVPIDQNSYDKFGNIGLNGIYQNLGINVPGTMSPWKDAGMSYDYSGLPKVYMGGQPDSGHVVWSAFDQNGNQVGNPWEYQTDNGGWAAKVIQLGAAALGAYTVGAGMAAGEAGGAGGAGSAVGGSEAAGAGAGAGAGGYSVGTLGAGDVLPVAEGTTAADLSSGALTGMTTTDAAAAGGAAGAGGYSVGTVGADGVMPVSGSTTAADLNSGALNGMATTGGGVTGGQALQGAGAANSALGGSKSDSGNAAQWLKDNPTLAKLLLSGAGGLLGATGTGNSGPGTWNALQPGGFRAGWNYQAPAQKPLGLLSLPTTGVQNSGLWRYQNGLLG